MRTPNISSVSYTPGNVPEEYSARHISEELRNIQAAISGLAAGHVDLTTVAPAKPREGDWRLADNVGWRPGLMKGFYGFHSGNWVFLG